MSEELSDDLGTQHVTDTEDVPLLVHAGRGKDNTVYKLKITRLDGPQAGRGFKGTLEPDSSLVTLARTFGNGVYRVEGVNSKFKVLAVSEHQISIPDLDDEPTTEGAHAPQPYHPGIAGVHGMRIVAQMADNHQQSATEQNQTLLTAMRDMTASTVATMTAFLESQRAADRERVDAQMANMQAFYATMLQMQQGANTQQMEILTRFSERDQGGPNQIETLLQGIQLAHQLGAGSNEDTPPWAHALQAGSGMLQSLAQMHAAGGTGLPNPMQRPALPAQGAPPAPAPEEPKRTLQPRKRRLPVNREEVGALVRLKATLHKRGIPLDTFMSQVTEHYRQAPESELFDSGGDGPNDVDPEHATQHPQDTVTRGVTPT
jgi:hypothetical protein